MRLAPYDSFRDLLGRVEALGLSSGVQIEATGQVLFRGKIIREDGRKMCGVGGLIAPRSTGVGSISARPVATAKRQT